MLLSHYITSIKGSNNLVVVVGLPLDERLGISLRVIKDWSGEEPGGCSVRIVGFGWTGLSMESVEYECLPASCAGSAALPSS